MNNDDNNGSSSSSSKSSNNPNVFDHEFGGLSVWLEPDDASAIHREAEYLQKECGGPSFGLYPFVPHCTLLYNFKNEDSNYHVEEAAKEKLEAIKSEFRTKHADNSDSSGATMMIQPTDFYFFHYPKEADDGRGFGCVISMLLLQKSDWLAALQECCKQRFPVDERHKGSQFTPHMAFVYAPEAKMGFLRDYTENLKNRRTDLLQQFSAKRLSLWSTEGTLKDWRRIAAVEL